METSIWGQGVNVENPVEKDGVHVLKLLGNRDLQDDSAAASVDAVACADGVGGSARGGYASECAVTEWVTQNRSNPALRVLEGIAEKIATSGVLGAYTTFVGARRAGPESSGRIPLEMLSVGDSQGFFIDPQTRKVLYLSPTMNKLSIEAKDATDINHPDASILWGIFQALVFKTHIENEGQIPRDPIERWNYVREIALAYAHCVPDQLGPTSAGSPILWSGECPVGTEAWLFTDGVTRVMPPYEMEEIIKEHGTEAGFAIIVDLIKKRKDHFLGHKKEPDPQILLGRTPEGHRIFGGIATLTLIHQSIPKSIIIDAGDNTTLIRKTTWSTAETPHRR